MPITPHPDPRLNLPYLTPILHINEESANIRSFTVQYDAIPEQIECHPGQFVMVWVPGSDEIPMSISKIGPSRQISISVAKVGETTAKLFELKQGDMIGIRGPYGNSYQIRPGIAVVIGGGIGMASVLPLLYELDSLRKKENAPQIEQIICIEGAKTELELPFTSELRKLFPTDKELCLCTDDGSCGYHGFTTEKLTEILPSLLQSLSPEAESKKITVYTCGPEIMMKKLVDVCNASNIEVQASLERMMRCGFGLCGLCALEPTGFLVCKDGPIFTGEILKECTDFGKIHRDFSGKPYKI